MRLHTFHTEQYNVQKFMLSFIILYGKTTVCVADVMLRFITFFILFLQEALTYAQTKKPTKE